MPRALFVLLQSEELTSSVQTSYFLCTGQGCCEYYRMSEASRVRDSTTIPGTTVGGVSLLPVRQQPSRAVILLHWFPLHITEGALFPGCADTRETQMSR